MSAPGLLAGLGRASLEGGLVLLALWAATRLWPRMPSRLRVALWWLGALRMLVALVPVPRLPLRWAMPDGSAAMTTLDGPVSAVRAAWSGAAVLVPAGAAPGLVRFDASDLVAPGLALVWLAGVVLGVAILARRLLALQSTWRSAVPFDDPRIDAWQAACAARGWTRVPPVRIHADVAAPLAFGLGRPGILLPAGSAALSDEALALVLAHETGHIRRHDLALALVPAFAGLVFWFHPLVRLALREYASAREEACDADALAATGAAPHAYASLLLSFGVGSAELPGTASCRSSDARHLKRRLLMLARTAPSTPIRRLATAAGLAAFAVLAFAPVRLVAAHEGNARAGSAKASESTPVAYLLKTRGVEMLRGSVNERDFDLARGLKGATGDMAYFRLRDRAWATRDLATIAAVREAIAPEDEYAERQAPLARGLEQLERQERRIEEQQMALEARKEDPALRRSERDDLIVAAEELSAMRRALSVRRSELHRMEKASWAERDRIHQRSLQEIERIARAAIAAGVAEEIRD